MYPISSNFSSHLWRTHWYPPPVRRRIEYHITSSPSQSQYTSPDLLCSKLTQTQIIVYGKSFLALQYHRHALEELLTSTFMNRKICK